MTMNANGLMWAISAIGVLGMSATLAGAEGDARHGASLFRQCAACHSLAPGDHRTGPSLANVVGRKAGSVEGFRRYSDALKGARLTWDEATLDKWLASPQRLVPGNTMAFGGIRERQAREDLIAYLRAVGEGKATAQEGTAMGGGMMGGGMMGGGMMGGGMMGGSRLDLRKAPPEGQVASISHCADTYTIETADGKTSRIWEFNLRLKTDSSAQGPKPGKPVAIGAGMRGDRASIVFAKPSEISAFIRERCD